MDLKTKMRNKKYDRVMSRVYNQSKPILKSSSVIVTRHDPPSSVRLSANSKPSVTASSVYSELPTVLNDYVPDSDREKPKRRLVVKPRKTLKSLDPALSPPRPRPVPRLASRPQNASKQTPRIRAESSAPAILTRDPGRWSESHVRQCYSSRSHSKLKELKDEIQMYHENEKLMKIRSRLYKSCGVVLDDFGFPAADKAIQVECAEEKQDKEKGNIESYHVERQDKTKNQTVHELLGEHQDNIQVITCKDVQSISTSNEDLLNIQTSDLVKIIKENSSLQTENKALKEELQRSAEFQIETKKNFAIVQIQLDKIIDLLQNTNQASSSSIIANDDRLSTSEDGSDVINLGNLKFPIETKEQLDALEYKLLEKDVMTYLVKKFSATCGASGLAKISKIGLTLMKLFIKDDLLNQFTWKGIKGSTKVAFVQYVKIRELFYKVAHLADKSCSFSDSDSFIQNSAIKHSGQRIKRHILSASQINVKRTKTEINIIEKDSTKMMIPDTEINDNVLTNERDNTDGVNGNEINKETSYSEINHESETNKISTHGDIRDMDDNEMDKRKSSRIK